MKVPVKVIVGYFKKSQKEPSVLRTPWKGIYIQVNTEFSQYDERLYDKKLLQFRQELINELKKCDMCVKEKIDKQKNDRIIPEDIHYFRSLDIEWLYLFDTQKDRLYVYKIYYTLDVDHHTFDLTIDTDDIISY